MRKPAHVPAAYETALKELARRKKFRQILEAEFTKLKNFVKEEHARR